MVAVMPVVAVMTMVSVVPMVTVMATPAAMMTAPAPAAMMMPVRPPATPMAAHPHRMRLFDAGSFVALRHGVFRRRRHGCGVDRAERQRARCNRGGCDNFGLLDHVEHLLFVFERNHPAGNQSLQPLRRSHIWISLTRRRSQPCSSP